MSFILGLCAIGVASLTSVVVGLRRAPEAYEDAEGFHLIVPSSPKVNVAPAAFVQGSPHGRYWSAVLALFRSSGSAGQPRPRVSART